MTINEIGTIRTIIGNYESLWNDKEVIKHTGISEELKVQAYQELQNNCLKIKSRLIELVNSLPEIISCPAVERTVERTEKPSNINTNKETYDDWKENLSKRINDIYDRSIEYIQGKEVYSKIYQYMRNRYGIVWEQDFKEWRRDHISTPTKISVVYNNSTYKSIFDAVLDDMYNTAIKNHPDVLSIDELLQPLIEKYNNVSKSEMLNLIYNNMEQIYNVNWDRYIKKYCKENDVSNISKEKLIAWNHGLIERVRMTIDFMLNNNTIGE